MAAYLAMRLEAGIMNYNTLMSTKWVKYKEDIDTILAADGYTVNSDGTVTK